MGVGTIVAFLVLSFGAFWLATPLAATSPALPLLLASVAPGVIALILVALTRGRGGVRALIGTLGRWRVAPGWYLAAIGIPILAGLGILLASIALGATPTIELATVLPLAPVIVLFAAGEELGWRGLLLPWLLARMPVLGAALVMGVIHAAYHLPLWAAAGMPAPIYSFLAFAAASLAFGIIWTWLYRGTGGSVLHTTLFHGSINIAGNAFFGGIAASYLDWLLPVAFWIVAVSVVVRKGWSLGSAPAPQPAPYVV